MKIEVGMKLHVRADLNVGYGVNEEMEKLADEEVTVCGICGNRIKIEEDEGKYSWSYNMFSEFVFWIKDVLEKHKKWLNEEDGGERADLRGADLRYADLSGADLRYAVLVKLEIPKDAKRSSATTRKCRCSKAKIISITGIVTRQEYDEAFSQRDKRFVYRVGETVVPDSFDEDRWNECSNGIHFFITKQEAIDY